MFSIFLLGLAALTGVCIAAPNSKIMDGSPATIEEYPSLVQVESYDSWDEAWYQMCGASILNNAFILSAAHCFAGRFYSHQYRRIRAGSTYRNTGGVIHYIVEDYKHPTYDPVFLPEVPTNRNADITVVRLMTNLVYSPVIQPATIITPNYQIPDNSPVVFAGWGADELGGPSPDQLQEVTLYTINLELCRERYMNTFIPAIVTDNMICSGLLDTIGKGPCERDFGGPLYFGGVVAGVFSWGFVCGELDFPAVSTRVASYTDWILSVV